MVFPVRFVWASSEKGLRSRKKKARGAPKIKTPPDLGEALVTECPYEAVRENFLKPGLN
jgi:hypothetical protein